MSNVEAKRYRSPVALFAREYSAIDIELLVERDRANEDVSLLLSSSLSLSQETHSKFPSYRFAMCFLSEANLPTTNNQRKSLFEQAGLGRMALT